MDKLEEVTDIKKHIKSGRIRSILCLIIVMIIFLVLIYIKDRDNFKNILLLFSIAGPISIIIGLFIQKIFGINK